MPTSFCDCESQKLFACDLICRYIETLEGTHVTLGGKHETLGGRHATLEGKHATLEGKYATLGGKYEVLPKKRTRDTETLHDNFHLRSIDQRGEYRSIISP